ncbi:MAG: 7-cyano-7-deazaguanine synthase QueC [Planctomycetota bacterium]
MSTRTPAVVLLSGGLDSATALALARQTGHICHALTISYDQRHSAELDAAKHIAQHLGAASHRTVQVELRAIGGSALTDDIPVPKSQPPKGHTEQDEPDAGIPITYVPARNLTFLSIAAGYAEVVGARDLYVGVNAVDYSGYPDCRPEFIEAFERAANLGTKLGVEAEHEPWLRVRTPLIDMTKADIIKTGVRLGVDYAHTLSCYDPEDSLACGRCDACRLRTAGFEAAGIADPTRYAVS